MNTYIVMKTGDMPKTPTREQLKEFHEKELFEPLRVLASNSGGQLSIANEMKLIGVAVVEASDEIVKMLKGAGYQVHLNSQVGAI